jgi:hypothetical protein
MKGVALGVGVVAGAIAVLSLSPGAGSRPRALPDCTIPFAAPLWIDYAEGSVRPDVRAVLAHPGVVVATSGTVLPPQFRQAGAATTYFVLKLPAMVGDPTDPADPSVVPAAADALYDRAVASTGCSTPIVTLNELLGSDAPTPWSPATAAYRASVLALVQELAAKGAQPALLVHGDPDFTSVQAGDFWRTVAQSASLVYEAYYDASKIYPLGPLLANRRMRIGMRNVVDSFASMGIPPARLGFMLGFHSALGGGVAGRQGLQPTTAWLRVVKWEAFAAKQVALEEGIPTLWSWGWATFGPESVDPDKAVAACTWLWARDPTLCDAPGMVGPGFQSSRTEASIIVPPGDSCILPGARIATAAGDRLARLTGDRHAALTAQFGRAVLARVAPIDPARVPAVERRVIAREFHGNRDAYLRALVRRGATAEVARGVIADELRRRVIAERFGSPFEWIAALEATAVDRAICRRDNLPGTPQPISVGNARDVGTVPLASLLPFLFRDVQPPAAPATPSALRSGKRVTITWTPGREVDLAGYDLFRTTPDGQIQKLNDPLIGTSAWVDVSAPAGGVYSLRAVDTSGNRSVPSPPSPAP